MNFKSADVIKSSLAATRDERAQALNHITFNIEMKEGAIQRAGSAGARTRMTNELVALKVEKIRRERACSEIAQAILDFDATVAGMSEKGGQS